LARSTKGELKPTTIRKDNDFRKEKRMNAGLFRMAQINKDLLRSLVRDIWFFKTRGLLDYSLLFAIELTEDKKFDENNERLVRGSALGKRNALLKPEGKQPPTVELEQASIFGATKKFANSPKEEVTNKLGISTSSVL